MQGRTTANRKYSIMFGGTVSVFLALVLYALFSTTVRNEQEAFALDLYQDYTFIFEDTLATLLPLNDLGFSRCTPETLRAMETALFRSAFSKQIMFYENGEGVCTTGTGILSTPVRRSTPDMIGPEFGAEVWANREIILDLTGEHFRAIIAKIGNYSVMLDPGILQPRQQLPFDWKLVFKDPVKPGRVVDVFSGNDNKTAGAYYLQDYFYEYCDSERPYFCLQLPTSRENLVGHYSQAILLMLTVCLALGYIGEYRAFRWMNNRLQLKTRVARGYKRDAFYWMFQPIVDLRSKQVIGCEVLSRFRDEYSELAPKDFLPWIREAGKTAEFTRRMIRHVMPELEQCHSLPDSLKVSLNIFPVDVKTGDINDILQLPELINSRFRITLEIIEDEELDEESARLNLSRVHDSGFMLSIDDFGTGYSNLKQIRKLDASFLKIDRSYVMDLEDQPVRSSLIPHIITMARELGIDVIAEGIETEMQRAILFELGVSHGQGWLFGRAMPLRELEELVMRSAKSRFMPRLEVAAAS